MIIRVFIMLITTFGDCQLPSSQPLSLLTAMCITHQQAPQGRLEKLFFFLDTPSPCLYRSAMPPIKSMIVIANKWTVRTQAATPDYKRGVETTPKDWAGNTAAATAAYDSGIASAQAGNRWQTGVTKAGTAKWRANTLAKGPERFAQGVRLSVDNYVNGFKRYADVIAQTNLPPRGPRGSTENYERSRVMGQTLHEARVAA